MNTWTSNSPEEAPLASQCSHTGQDERAEVMQDAAPAGGTSRKNRPPDHELLQLLLPSTYEYPRGAFRRTQAAGYVRKGDEVSIQDVLQPSMLTSAALICPEIDVRWLLDTVGMERVQQQIWMVPKCNPQLQIDLRSWQAAHGRHGGGPTLRHPRDVRKYGMGNEAHAPPPLNARVWILFRAWSVRIVVGSADLTPRAFGEALPPSPELGFSTKAIAENLLFLLDLPRITQGADGSDRRGHEPLLWTPFKRELVFFLRELRMPAWVEEALHAFDFLPTAHMTFVHSMQVFRRCVVVVCGSTC